MSCVNRRCPACGMGTIRALAVAERRRKWRGAEIDVPAALEIPTCDGCGMEWFDSATTQAMDALAPGRSASR